MTLLLHLCLGASSIDRLVKIVGVRAALDLLLSAKTVSAQEASRLGIVKEIYPAEEPAEGFVDYIVKYALSDAMQTKYKSFRGTVVKDEAISKSDWVEIEQSICKNSRGQLAPLRLLECVKAAASEQAFNCEAEDNKLREYAKHPQSHALQYIHFAEKKCVVRTASNEIKRVAVVGGGTMGCGIVMSLIDAKIPVILLETSKENASKSVSKIESTFKASSAYKTGKLDENALRNKMALVTAVTEFERLKDADLVIEAVFENMELKRSIFKELDRVCKPGAILATNTSYLSIDDIASVTSRRSHVVGTRKLCGDVCAQLIDVHFVV